MYKPESGLLRFQPPVQVPRPSASTQLESYLGLLAQRRRPARRGPTVGRRDDEKRRPRYGLAFRAKRKTGGYSPIV